MNAKFPFAIVRRRDLAALETKLAVAEKRAKDYARAAAQSGHVRDEALRDAGRLAADLRLIRVRLDQGRMPDRIGLSIEMASEALLTGYRYDRPFQQAVAFYVERMFLESPIGRESYLAGRVDRVTA